MSDLEGGRDRHEDERLPVTVVMITLNEGRNLPGALANVARWASDCFIVDSGSTDDTIDVALAAGAQVVQRRFRNFGDQWNFAVSRLPIRTAWTLKLDPDERLSAALKAEIASVTREAGSANGYSMPRRLWFMGQPLHVYSPVLRLWRTGVCKFTDVAVNEHPLIAGEVRKLRGTIEHHDSPNLHHLVDKQNRYTTMLAVQRRRGAPMAASPRLFGTALERRMFWMRLFFAVPFRYQLQWLHELIARGAWRDGRRGMEWARLRIMFRRLREMKWREMSMLGYEIELPAPQVGPFDERVTDTDLQKTVCSDVHMHHSTMQ